MLHCQVAPVICHTFLKLRCQGTFVICYAPLMLRSQFPRVTCQTFMMLCRQNSCVICHTFLLLRCQFHRVTCHTFLMLRCQLSSDTCWVHQSVRACKTNQWRCWCEKRVQSELSVNRCNPQSVHNLWNLTLWTFSFARAFCVAHGFP